MDGFEDNANDYYEILGLPRDATQEMISKQHRNLARQYHPDRAGPEGAKTFLLVSKAYKVLSDPKLRNIYDYHGEEGLENMTKMEEVLDATFQQLDIKKKVLIAYWLYVVLFLFSLLIGYHLDRYVMVIAFTLAFIYLRYIPALILLPVSILFYYILPTSWIEMSVSSILPATILLLLNCVSKGEHEKFFLTTLTLIYAKNWFFPLMASTSPVYVYLTLCCIALLIFKAAMRLPTYTLLFQEQWSFQIISFAIVYIILFVTNWIYPPISLVILIFETYTAYSKLGMNLIILGISSLINSWVDPVITNGIILTFLPLLKLLTAAKDEAGSVIFQTINFTIVIASLTWSGQWVVLDNGFYILSIMGLYVTMSIVKEGLSSN